MKGPRIRVPRFDTPADVGEDTALLRQAVVAQHDWVELYERLGAGARERAGRRCERVTQLLAALAGGGPE